MGEPLRAGRRTALSRLAALTLGGAVASPVRAAAPDRRRAGDEIVVGPGSSDVPDLLTALERVPAQGGRIVIRAGTYTLQGGLPIPGADPRVMGAVTVPLFSNVTVEGEGPGLTVLTGVPGEGTNLLGAWQASGIVLRGFTLRGGGNGGYGLALFACSDCRVEDVEVEAYDPRGSLNTGIGAFGTRNRFVRCRVHGAKVLGFELGYGDDGTEVLDCHVSGCMFGLQFDGYGSLPPDLRTGPNRNLRIVSCEFRYNGLGLLLTSCASAVVADTALRNNDGYGMAMASLGAGRWQDEEPFPATAMHVVATGLLVQGNGRGGAAAGVRLQGTGSSVSSSLFLDNQGPAVLLEGSGLIVSGCSFPSGQVCVQNNGAPDAVVVGCTRDPAATEAGVVGNPVTVVASPGF
jgi:hypothetical protein